MTDIFFMVHFRDQSLLMPGKGLEDIFIDSKSFSYPFISSLRFARALDYLAVFSGSPALYQI